MYDGDLLAGKGSYATGQSWVIWWRVGEITSERKYLDVACAAEEVLEVSYACMANGFL